MIVGHCASAKIEGRLGAGEHRQGSGKLVRGSVRAMGARWWLSRREGAGGGCDWSSGCARQGEKRCKWCHCDLLVLLGRREEERK
jgi:hypothetical protein